MNVKLSASQKSKPIFTAQDIYDIMQPILLRENKMRRRQEYFWIAGIDAKRHLVFIELLALGADNRLIIKAPEAYRMAIYKLADYVMFVHNHPSGRLLPSEPDKDSTNMLLKAGEIVNIKVVDHLIINETDFYSMATAGLLKQLRADPAYKVLRQDEVELLKMQMEARGVEKGLAEGKEIGRKEGELVGERKKAEEMALSLLGAGMTVDFVVKHTGLSKKAVQQLAKGRNNE
jgi:DNA repair protein RadC